ncbi:MAG: sortase [Anaerolineae bacterium]|nr:sortase [Anaerolineae bacterium]
MRDKRTIDELSTEELERILLMRKRQQRLERFRGMDERRLDVPLPEAQPALEAVALPNAAPLAVQAEAPLPAIAPRVPTPPAYLDEVPRFEEDLEAHGYLPRQQAPRREASMPGLGRGTVNRLLLLTEIGGFVGLILILYLAYQGIQRIDANIAKTDAISATSEAELRARQSIPTPTPIVSINTVVLPGGHVWSETGNHRFNLDEVPAPYRAQFQQVLAAPAENFSTRPTIAGGPVQIEIPAINVRASVRAGDDWAVLQAAVGHHPYSSRPGEQGNMVLTGHNDIFGEVFRDLPRLEAGDEIYILAEGGMRYTYRVREGKQVTPIDTWVLDQGLGAQTPLMTLITCYPYRVNTHRWIIFAELVSSS